MIPLIVLLVTATSSALARDPWQSWLSSLQNQEAPPVTAGDAGAAGRDLEVGVAIGVPTVGPNTPGNGFSVFGTPGWSPIASRANRVVRFDTPASYQLSLPGLPSESFYQQWNTPQRPHKSPKRPLLYPFQKFRSVQMDEPNNALYLVRSSYGQGAEDLKLIPVEWEETSSKMAPVISPLPRETVISESSGKDTEGASFIPIRSTQRRVGAFKVRSDRGYQITMEVPPVVNTVAESPTDGVLVMEMKATLYRPVG